jgi:hypothetical protein
MSATASPASTRPPATGRRRATALSDETSALRARARAHTQKFNPPWSRARLPATSMTTRTVCGTQRSLQSRIVARPPARPQADAPARCAIRIEPFANIFDRIRIPARGAVRAFACGCCVTAATLLTTEGRARAAVHGVHSARGTSGMFALPQLSLDWDGKKRDSHRPVRTAAPLFSLARLTGSAPRFPGWSCSTTSCVRRTATMIRCITARAHEPRAGAPVRARFVPDRMLVDARTDLQTPR